MKIKLTAVQQPVFRDALENLECTLDILEDNKDTDWLLTPDIDGVVVALGGNDLLRGFDPEFTKNNLDKIFMKHVNLR